MRNFTLSLLILLTSLPLVAQQIPAAGTDWSRPFFTRIDITFLNNDFHARWDISRCACGDLHILAEETLPGEIRTGEQLLLDGKVLLVNGYKGYEGPLTALLDSPVLMLQLLFVLLQKVEPSGPSAVTGMLNPEITEPIEAVILDNGIAYGAFPAPWSLKGTLTPSSSGQFRFELRFVFELPEAGEQLIQLTGRLNYQEQAFPVDDSMLLDGWSAAWLELNTENRSGLTPGMTLGQFKESASIP